MEPRASRILGKWVVTSEPQRPAIVSKILTLKANKGPPPAESVLCPDSSPPPRFSPQVCCEEAPPVWLAVGAMGWAMSQGGLPEDPVLPQTWRS